MKILIIARHFSPENTIGAIRLVKFAKYLKRFGNDVTVYAMTPTIDVTDAILVSDAAELPRIFPIQNSRFYTAIHDFFARRDRSGGGRAAASSNASGTVAKKMPSFKSKLFQAMYRIMWIWSDWDYYRHYRKDTRRDDMIYDVVFSSWNTDAAHRIALDVLKHGRAKKWIADFRDACVSVWPELTKNRDARHLLRRVYKNASLITLAFPSLIADNAVPASVPSAVLYNGFDPEDTAKIFDSAPVDSSMHLAYCGQIYSGHQDFLPLFSALSDLVDEGSIDPDRIVIDYAGQSDAVFCSQCASDTIRSRIVSHGFLPREQALKMEKRAHILLFAAWNSAAKPAIFPAKFLEYMMMEKPVLALISGELKNSLPKTVMDRTRLGCVIESSDGIRADQNLKAWLLCQYQHYLLGEALVFDPDRDAVDSFSYPNRTKELIALMEGVLREDCI